MAQDKVTVHYTQGNLLDRIYEGLRAVGKDPDNPSVGTWLQSTCIPRARASTDLADAAG